MKNITSYSRKLKNIPKKTIKNELYKLTLLYEEGLDDKCAADESMMACELQKHLKMNIHNDSIVTVLKKGSKFIGWSMSIPANAREGDIKSMFYIKNEYRSKGLGEYIFNKTMKTLKRRGFKQMFVAPWDDRSDAFFEKLNCKHTWGGYYLFTYRIKL